MLRKILAVVTLICIILTVLTACGGAASKKGGGDDTDAGKVLNDLEKLEKETGLEISDDVKDLLEDIDQADVEAVADAVNDIKATLDLPDGWEIKDSPDNIMLNVMKGTRMITVTGARIPGGESDIVEYTKKSRDKMTEYFDDAEITDIESVKLGNYEGARFIFDYSITKNMKQRQVYFFFFEGKNVYMIQGAYMNNDEGAAEEVEAIMASLKIEKK